VRAAVLKRLYFYEVCTNHHRKRVVIDAIGGRMASARAKAEQAQQAAVKAQSDAEKGRQKSYSYDANFVQPGTCLYLPFSPGHALLLTYCT